MVTFVLLAAALTVAGAITVAIPLLRGGVTAAAPGPAPWAAVAVTVLLVIGSAGLYVSRGHRPGRGRTPRGSPPSLGARPARRPQQKPQQLPGWPMPRRSYLAPHEDPLAPRGL